MIMAERIFCIVSKTFGIDKEDGREDAKCGSAIASAYGVSDLSECDNLPDQMSNLSVSTVPDLLEVVEDYSQSSVFELPVKTGEIVTYLGSEGSWVFVRASNGSDGYIPRRSCRILRHRSESSTHQHELSDVGYYSDHQRNEIDDFALRNSSKKGSRHRNSKSCSPSHLKNDIRNFRTDSESSSIHGEKSLRGSFTPQYRRYGSIENSNTPERHMHPRSHSDSLQLINPHNDDGYYNTTTHSAAVCGRKCGERCIHKANPNDIQKVGYPSDIHLGRRGLGLSKSKSSIIDDNRVDIIDNLEDRERMERRLEVNKKVVNHVRSALDEHRRVHKSASSYFHESDMKQCKEKVKNRKESCDSEPKTTSTKWGHPELIVIKDYEKAGDTDITVSCGDFATIIDDKKYTDWIYVQNENGDRGYIPTDYTLKHECQECDEEAKVTEEKRKYSKMMMKKQADINPNFDEMSRMFVHQNFSSNDSDNLNVVIGDTVYLGKEAQSIKDWLWVYSLRLQSFGYVPTTVVKDASEFVHVTI